MSDPKAMIAGAGVAGLSLGTALARRGWRVDLLDGGSGSAAAWGPVPAAWGRRQPAEWIPAEALPFDVVLPGECRVETPGRVSLLDISVVRGDLRRRALRAGVRVQRGRAEAALRRDGVVVGLRTDAGDERSATLTVDASGGGVLLGALPGAALTGGQLPPGEREPVALARLPVAPEQVQTAWAGRAQLLLDLPGPGALAWRCVSREGDRIWIAATAGRGTTASAAREVLARAVAPIEPELEAVTIRWLPCRRPLDTLAAPGLLTVGAAAAWVDTLMGITTPMLLPVLEEVAAALEPVRGGAPPGRRALHRVAAVVQRGAGATWAARAANRRLLDRLGPGGREGLVVTGGAGARAWWRALDGRSLLDGVSAVRVLAGRMPRAWARAAVDASARAAALRFHHAAYPREHELFALDRWQAREELLFRPLDGAWGRAPTASRSQN